MELDLVSVSATNFKAVRRTVEVPVGELPAGGLTLVTGRNLRNPDVGANAVGKTTLWDAVVWALYGKTIRGLRGTDVRCWGADGRTSVSVTLRLDDRLVSIQRSLSPSSLKLVEKGTSRTVDQDEVDSLVRLSFQEFVSSVIFPQGASGFVGLQPSQKSALLESVLDISAWARAGQSARVLERTLSDEADKLRQRLQYLKGRADAEALERLRKLSRRWREERAARKRALRAKIADAEKELRAARRRMETAQAEAASKDTALAKTRRELSEVARKVEELRNERDELRREASVAAERVDAARLALRRLERAYEKGRCGVCGQKVTEEHLEAERRRLVAAAGKAERRKESLDAEIARLEKALRRPVGRMGSLDQKMRELERERHEAWRRATAAQQRYGELQSRLTALHADLEALDHERNEYEEDYRKAKEAHRRLQREIEEAEKELRALERRRSAAAFWTGGFKELAMQEVAAVLDALGAESTRILSELGLEGWRVEFTCHVPSATDWTAGRPGFGMVVLPPGHESQRAVPWDAYSGGEGQRVRIAVQLAVGELVFRRRGVWPKVQVFDEPTSWLSVEGVDQVMSSLAGWAETTGRRVIVCDHRALDSHGAVQAVVRVERGEDVRVDVDVQEGE